MHSSRQCNFTFDALVIQLIHKHALPENLMLHVYTNTTNFPFNNLQYIEYTYRKYINTVYSTLQFFKDYFMNEGIKIKNDHA